MKSKLFYLAAFAVACAAMAFMLHGGTQKGPLAKFNARVQAAYADTFDRLTFPQSADEKYRGQVAGFLAGCLDSCIGRKTDFYGQRITLKNCRPGCACITNVRMEASPSDFLYNINKPSKDEMQGVKQCIGEQGKDNKGKAKP